MVWVDLVGEGGGWMVRMVFVGKRSGIESGRWGANI